MEQGILGDYKVLGSYLFGQTFIMWESKLFEIQNYRCGWDNEWIS